VFDVLAGRHAIARNLDVARSVGVDQPYHLVFTVTVARPALDIAFVPHAGQPLVSGFELQPAAGAPQAPATRLVWGDDFNGPRGSPPSPRRWTYDVGGRWGYGTELQYYTRRAQNASLDGHGHLVLQALRQTYRGPDGVQRQYTSARIKTQSRFTMLYGRAEARIEVPARAHGLLADFWAVGNNIDTIGWPRSGEIDPMEVGLTEPTKFLQAIHMPKDGRNYAVVWIHRVPTPLAAGYHIFGFEWDPGVVRLLIDGQQAGSLTQADAPRGSFVFRHRFYLILNLTVGGWDGTPDRTTHWPAVMKVDWVRVWR
jgi:beta-glucanase (GH16 family)